MSLFAAKETCPRLREGRRNTAAKQALQRLDLHLAELDHARAVLQRERAAQVFAVLHVGGLLTVEHHNEMWALRRDFVSVPLAGGFRHRIDLGDDDDLAGAVGWVRTLVEDIDLVADLGVDLLRVVAADED